MADLICGRHKWNGAFVNELCPICVMEEETKTTPQDEIDRLKRILDEASRKSRMPYSKKRIEP